MKYILFLLSIICFSFTVFAESSLDRSITVGVYDNPPKIFRTDDGKISGFHADLLRAIALEHDFKLEFYYNGWAELLSRLETGEIDMMVDVAYSKDRADRFILNEETVFVNWASVYASRGFNPENVLDLDGKRVACLQKDIHMFGETGLQELARKFKISITIIEVSSYEETFKLVEAGGADAAVVNRIFGAAKGAHYNIQRTPIIFNPISIRYAFSKKSPASLYVPNEIDASLRKMKADTSSLYYKIADSYLPGFGKKISIIPVWIYYFVPSATAIVIILLVLVSLLKKEIRKRVTAEQKSEHARKEAEEANQAKSYFLASMSHEIRTPLNAIIGFSQILLKDNSLSLSHKKSLATIGQSGVHLLELINDILDLSKVEAGKVSLHIDTFNLHNLLKDVFAIFEAQVKSKGLLFELHIHDDLPDCIKGDQQRIRQIIINLVGNALKFTDRGSITISAEGYDDSIRISIKDTGRGVPSELTEKIFEAFEQGERKSQNIVGTGLGLALCQQLANLMDGKISIVSEEGTGSDFIFTFTCKPGEALVCVENDPFNTTLVLHPDFKNTKLLVVDDKEENCTVARLLLESAGFTVYEAYSAREGIDLYKKHFPSVILMDIIMPDMDGNAAIRLIRNAPQGEKCTIIALSASVLKEEEDQSLSAGANAFLRKPYLEYQLLEIIGNHSEIQFITNRNESELKEEISPDSLVIGEEYRSKISRAARIGDISLLKEYINELAEINTTAANYLERLADNFDLSAILEMTQS